MKDYSGYTSNLVARALRSVKPEDRRDMLRHLLASTAAGLAIEAGKEEAALDLYKVADRTATMNHIGIDR